MAVDYGPQIAALTTTVNALAARATALESRMTALEGQLDTAEADIVTLEARPYVYVQAADPGAVADGTGWIDLP